LFGGIGEGYFEEQVISNSRTKFVQLRFVNYFIFFLNKINNNIIIRYYSNEIYVFDSETEKFDTFYLYTSPEFKVPFTIFHNCSSAIVKNHLIFLYGGEVLLYYFFFLL